MCATIIQALIILATLQGRKILNILHIFIKLVFSLLGFASEKKNQNLAPLQYQILNYSS